MKTLDLSNIVAGTRRLGAVRATFDHMMESLAETIDALARAATNNNQTNVMLLWGCVNSGSGLNYILSAGAVYYQGEIYQVPAFTGTSGGAPVPVLNISTTWRAGDPVAYSDASTFNTHKIRTMVWTLATSGTGLSDFSALGQTLFTTIQTAVALKAPSASPALTGIPSAPTAAPGTNTTQIATTAFTKAAIDAVIAAAPGALDTLNELAAALGNDASFASTVTTALAGKLSNSAGAVGATNLATDAVTTAKIQNGAVTDAKLASTFNKAGDGNQMLTKKLTASWNMDTITGINVTHGLTLSKIISVTGVVTDNAGTTVAPISSWVQNTNTADRPQLAFGELSGTDISLRRTDGSAFDGAGWNAASVKLLVVYEP